MRQTAPQLTDLKLPITDYKMQVLRSVFNRFVDFVNRNLFSGITTQDIFTVVFATAATDVTAIHSLGRLPRGYLVLGVDVSGAVINSNKAKWTTGVIVLRSSTPNTTALIVVV